MRWDLKMISALAYWGKWSTLFFVESTRIITFWRFVRGTIRQGFIYDSVYHYVMKYWYISAIVGILVLLFVMYLVIQCLKCTYRKVSMWPSKWLKHIVFSFVSYSFNNDFWLVRLSDSPITIINYFFKNFEKFYKSKKTFSESKFQNFLRQID